MTWIHAPVFAQWISPIVGYILSCSVWLMDNVVENATVFVWGFFLYLVFAEHSTFSLDQVKLNFVFYTMYYFKSLCMCSCVCICSPVCQHTSMYIWKPEIDFRCLITQVSTFSFGCCFETGSFTDHGPSFLRVTGCCVSTYSVLAQQTRATMCSFLHLWYGQYSVPFDYMRTALQA